MFEAEAALLSHLEGVSDCLLGCIRDCNGVDPGEPAIRRAIEVSIGLKVVVQALS
jgi:hypothetical protein